MFTSALLLRAGEKLNMFPAKVENFYSERSVQTTFRLQQCTAALRLHVPTALYWITAHKKTRRKD